MEEKNNGSSIKMKKKKIIKVNFKDFWENFDPEDNFIINLLRKKYNVIISNDPDYVFYSVYQRTKKVGDLSKKGDFIRKISPKLYVLLRKVYVKLTAKNEKKMEIPKGNFIKIFYSGERGKPNMKEWDWAFSPYSEEQINHPNYMRIPVHMICESLFGKERRKLPLKRNIDFEKIKKEKTKFCNFIYSQGINSRNNFFKRLSEYKKIDAPGRCMNNMPPISDSSPRKSRVSPDWVKTKLDFLKKYKFTIAFENSGDSYVTEKLVHPLLVNSIPIYFGNEQVKKDFNTKCFINYNDFGNMKEFIRHIIKVDNDDKLYKQYLEQQIFKDKKQQNFDNEERIEKRLNEIVESKK